MSVRLFFPADSIPATVEPFGSDINSGCIVRWDFQPIKAVIPAKAKRAASRRRKSVIPVTDQEAPATAPPQPTDADTRIVTFSEMRYIGIPDPERVIADIQADLDLRYADRAQPEIDLDAYRTAIAALSNP